MSQDSWTRIHQEQAQRLSQSRLPQSAAVHSAAWQSSREVRGLTAASEEFSARRNRKLRLLKLVMLQAAICSLSD